MTEMTQDNNSVVIILRELSYEAKTKTPLGIKNLLNASFLIDRPPGGRVPGAGLPAGCQVTGKDEFQIRGAAAALQFRQPQAGAGEMPIGLTL